MKRLLLAVLVLPLAGCATPLTPGRVSASFGEVFAGLYVEQQERLGQPGLDPQDLQVVTTCRRSGTDVDGPGEDWVCAVQYVDRGTAGAQAFDLQVKPEGCWKADGAPGVQLAQLVDPVTKQVLDNPLLQFDGCLDTSWR